MFVRFACGLSRLPTFYQPNKNLKIIFEVSAQPEALPRAATCFWSIYLPIYPNKEIMKKKLLIALSNCADIDADYTIQ